MKTIVFSFLFFVSYFGFTQYSFSRLETDFSIKEKNADGSMKLTMGKAFFDLKQKQIVYDINFPKKELIVMRKDTTYRIVDDKIVEKKLTIGLVEFSVFNLALQGDLPYFGVKNTTYTLQDTEVTDGMVISTWMPPEETKKFQGKVMLSQKNRQLFGMISFLPNGDEIMAKQFFRKYQNYQGLQFPTEVLHFTYFGGKENKKITSYKNVKLNNYENDNYYNYPLPN